MNFIGVTMVDDELSQ